MPKSFRFILLAGLALAEVILLGACGGETTPSFNSTSTNVALASHGATVTSYMSAGGESYVIDGDTGATNFWQAAAQGDFLTIDFSQAYNIDEVTVVATDLTSYADFSIWYSMDNSTYLSLNNQTSCTSASLYLSSAGYSCKFNTAHTAQYFKFVIEDNTATPKIHEIQVMGQ